MAECQKSTARDAVIFPAPTNTRTFVLLRLLGVFAGVLGDDTVQRGDLSRGS